MKFKLGRELSPTELEVAIACGARDLKDFVLAVGKLEGDVVGRGRDHTDSAFFPGIQAFLIAEVLKS